VKFYKLSLGITLFHADGWMDRGDKPQSLYMFALRMCLKPKSFTVNILPSLSAREHYFQNRKASSAGILQKIQVHCRHSQPHI